MYKVLQCGMIVGLYETLEEAEAEADRLNAEADEELGYELVGDGAATVVEEEEEEEDDAEYCCDRRCSGCSAPECECECAPVLDAQGEGAEEDG